MTLAAAVVMLAHPALADELEPLAIHEDEFYLRNGAPTQLNLFGYIPRGLRAQSGGRSRYPAPWGGVGFIA